MGDNINDYAVKALDFSDEVLQRENDRLKEISDNIDNIYSTYERKSKFKESKVQVEQAWRYVYLTLIIGLIIVASLIFVKNKFNLLFIDWLIIVVLGALLIYLTILYVRIKTRSLLDYNKIGSLNLKEVDLPHAVGKYGIVDGPLCKVDQCCSGGLIFSEIDNQCIDSNVEPFLGNYLQSNSYESICYLGSISSKYQ